jgi:hypothetical protein
MSLPVSNRTKLKISACRIVRHELKIREMGEGGRGVPPLTILIKRGWGLFDLELKSQTTYDLKRIEY